MSGEAKAVGDWFHASVAGRVLNLSDDEKVPKIARQRMRAAVLKCEMMKARATIAAMKLIQERKTAK